jgi:hypothetical protein
MKEEGRRKREEGWNCNGDLKSNVFKRLAERTVGIAWEISYTV